MVLIDSHIIVIHIFQTIFNLWKKSYGLIVKNRMQIEIVTFLKFYIRF